MFRPVDERLERRCDELAELLDRRLPEHRRGIADEVDPELAWDLRGRRRRPEPHPALLEAFRLERPGERLLDDEDDPVAARLQHLPDPDTVVRRAVGPFGEEDDRGHRLGDYPPATIARCPIATTTSWPDSAGILSPS